jgi:menaquinol-cytochrome c reductase iron-sulfur subunit
MSAREISDVVAWLSSQRTTLPGQPYSDRFDELGRRRISMSAETGMSRRAMLVKIGLLLNGIVGVVLAVPIVRYLVSPVTRERQIGYESWLSLGGLEQFPAGQTRLATYRNPAVNAWDGETADIACWVRNVDDQNFQVFAINCAHLGCPVRWFAQSSLFMCPCHGGAYYQDGSRASGPPERGLFQYHYKIEDGKLLIKAGEMPTPGQPVANKAGGKPTCA